MLICSWLYWVLPLLWVVLAAAVSAVLSTASPTTTLRGIIWTLSSDTVMLYMGILSSSSSLTPSLSLLLLIRLMLLSRLYKMVS